MTQTLEQRVEFLEKAVKQIISVLSEMDKRVDHVDMLHRPLGGIK